MVKTCKFNNCKKQPNFNYADQKNGIYCLVHKDPNMIDVISKRCLADNCNTQPNFNYTGEIKAIYCFSHKQPGMVNIQHKKCFFGV